MPEYPKINDKEHDLLKKIVANTAGIESAGGGGDTADTIIYNNITSGLTAEDVQAAIDEVVEGLEDRIESVEDSVTDGQVIVFNGASGKSGKKATGTGIAELTNGVLGVATPATDYVAPGAVTTSGLTMATARLLGRTTASTGAPEEITVGSGLSLSAGSLTATGSGTKTLRQWDASLFVPASANSATFDTRNAIALYDFDDTTAESIVVVGIVPEGTVLTGGITVRLFTTATGASSGDMVFTTAFERVNTDIDSDSFATGVDSAATAVNGSNGIPTVVSINHSSSQIDGLTAGDLFRIKITRKTGDAADTVTGDVELIAVEFRIQ